MQVWTEIRRKVLVEKVSRRQICRDYGLSHYTVAKILDQVEPPGYQRVGERPRPKLGPFLEVIEEILRLTAKCIFERLVDEHGYTGSESHVRRYLAQPTVIARY
jgi:transposase